MHHYVKHLLIPHHTNNFRARLLHAELFFLYACALLFINALVRISPRIDPNILGFATDIRVERLLEATNQKRTESGHVPLRLSRELSLAAAEKAKHMFTNDYWAHYAPDGTSPWDFITRYGYVYTIAGENLAKNFSNSEGVVEAWMNSPTHRENILKDQYEDIGFAVVDGVLNGEETTLVVQMFGKSPGYFPNQASAVAKASPLSSKASEQYKNPAPTPAAAVAGTGNVEKPPLLTQEAQTVMKNPLIDIGQISKQISLGLMLVLIALVAIDSLYMKRYKIVRASGRALAHIAFLSILTSAIWLLSFGSIL